MCDFRKELQQRNFSRSMPWIYNDKSKSIEMDQLFCIMSKMSNSAVAIVDSALFLPSFQYLVVRVPHSEATVHMCYSDSWLNSGHGSIKLKIKTVNLNFLEDFVFKTPCRFLTPPAVSRSGR